MSLSAGTRLGPYEIVALLGAADPEALARFEREARAVAALNHPEILSLFDIGSQDGTAHAMTELPEGRDARGAARARSAALCARSSISRGGRPGAWGRALLARGLSEARS